MRECLFMSHIEGEDLITKVLNARPQSSDQEIEGQVFSGIISEPYLEDNFDFTFDFSSIESLSIENCAGLVHFKNVRGNFNFYLILYEGSSVLYGVKGFMFENVLFYDSGTNALDCNEFTGGEDDFLQKYFGN